MDINTYTLRLAVLREAHDRYSVMQEAAHAGSDTNLLLQLKINECDTMLRELSIESVKKETIPIEEDWTIEEVPDEAPVVEYVL